MSLVVPPYPPPRYHGEPEVSATLRRADSPPDYESFGVAYHYLANQHKTDGDYGLYRVDIGPAGGGPGPHFHRAMSEAFFVLSGTLKLYDGTKLLRTFPVATGQAIYPTPAGVWRIADKQRAPWWYPPTYDAWAKGLKPVPPGPGNPLGTRWMGLNAAGVGIHGTDADTSIGYSASHGCIRMHVPDAEWLFERVHVGTPVVIL